MITIPAAAARDSLSAAVHAVLSEEALAELAPGITPPAVYDGFPVNEPPFYAAVDELAEDIQAQGGASCGHATVTFALRVWLCARHRDLRTAADTVQCYVDAVMSAVLADQSLNFTVDNAFPSLDTTGTATDPDKRYLAAARVRVTCTATSVCPSKIKEIVNAAYRDQAV